MKLRRQKSKIKILFSDTSECIEEFLSEYNYHLRGFDDPEYDGVYLLQYEIFGLENLLLINNRPIYQKIYSRSDEKPDDKCIWWDKSRHWFLGFCEDLGTTKSYAYTKQDSKCLKEISRNQIQWMKTSSDLELEDAYVIQRLSDTTDLRASNLECPQFDICHLTPSESDSFSKKKYPGYCRIGCTAPVAGGSGPEYLTSAVSYFLIFNKSI